MSSLRENFDELLERVRQGRELGHASFEPIYYLIFPPSEVLEVKRLVPGWMSRLRNEGWEVDRFSIAEQIAAILNTVPQRKIWLAADRDAPQDWQRTNKSLTNAISNGALEARLRERLEPLEGNRSAILLVTDLEALHPYLRIGAIEGKLSGAFSVPTIFFYPGTRAGKIGLRFLGFYREDGNYRSVHVGG
jgi:bacteriophage exclusion system BrxB-like protein